MVKVTYTYNGKNTRENYGKKYHTLHIFFDSEK